MPDATFDDGYGVVIRWTNRRTALRRDAVRPAPQYAKLGRLRALECGDLRLVLQQESKLVDAREQAVLRERLKHEREFATIGQRDRLRRDVDVELDAGMLEQIAVLVLAEDDGEQAVLERIAAEDVRDLAR